MSRSVFLEAKQEALRRLNDTPVFGVFAECLKTKGVPTHAVYYDREGSERRIRDAVLISHAESMERFDEISGETDGDTIWIIRGMGFDDVVETLLHESMHDSVFIRRSTRSGTTKGLSEEMEHSIMENIISE